MAVTEADKFATQVAGESASGGPKRFAVDDDGFLRIRVPNLIMPTGRGATLVVAGSDASETVKNQADYVCAALSVDNEVEINTAIAALTAGRTHPETVKLVGSFTISAPISMPDYTYLDITEARITLADGSDCYMITNSDQVGGNTFLKITKGILDGNRAGQTPGGDFRGVYFLKVNYFEIDDIYVTSVATLGVHCNQCNYFHVSGIFDDQGWTGFGETNCNYWDADVKINSSAQAASHSGVHLDGGHTWTLRGYSKNAGSTAGVGLTLGCENGDLHDGDVIGFNTASNGGYGKAVTGLNPNLVYDIRFHGGTDELNGDAGLRISNANDIKAFSPIARNNGQSPTATYPYGIIVRGATGSSGCTISEPRCYDDQTAKTQKVGIYEESPCDYNQFVNVDVRGNLQTGLVKSGAHSVANGIGYWDYTSAIRAAVADILQICGGANLIVPCVEQTGNPTDYSVNALTLTHRIYFNSVRLDDGGVYTNATAAAKNPTANDVPLIPAVPVVGDGGYVCKDVPFGQIIFVIGTQGVWTGTIEYLYYNGTEEVVLPDISDGTVNFTAAAGLRYVTYTIPGDWVATTIDGVTGYHVHWRVATYTDITTRPLATQIYNQNRVEDSAIKPALQGLSTFHSFDGSYEVIRMSDTALLTFVLSPFTLIAVLNATDTENERAIMAKWQSTHREWLWAITNADKMYFAEYDWSKDITVSRLTDAAITMGAPQVFIVVDDGRGGADAMDGVTLYGNGGVLASTPTNNAGFVAMENETGAPLIGGYLDANSIETSLFQGKGSWFCVIPAALTAAQAWAVTQRLRAVCGF